MPVYWKHYGLTLLNAWRLRTHCACHPRRSVSFISFPDLRKPCGWLPSTDPNPFQDPTWDYSPATLDRSTNPNILSVASLHVLLGGSSPLSNHPSLWTFSMLIKCQLFTKVLLALVNDCNCFPSEHLYHFLLVMKSNPFHYILWFVALNCPHFQ